MNCSHFSVIICKAKAFQFPADAKKTIENSVSSIKVRAHLTHMKDKLLTFLKLFLGWPITFISFFFIFKLIKDKSGIISFNIKDINIFLLTLGTLCFFIYFILRTMLWQKILASKGHVLPLREASFLWATSEIRRFVPGNIWSFASRILLFSQKKIDKKVVVFLMIQEAQSVALGNAILSVFSFSFVLYTFFPNIFVLPVILLGYYIVFAGFLLYTHKNIKIKMRLLTYSIGAFFFFSLGTYFSITSITSLSPYYLLTFLSFFSLCYLIGYLSIITPMGLGVREAILAAGLAQFIAAPIAAAAAIYTRILLILSEIIFFLFSRLWHKTKNSYIQFLEQYIKNNWQVIIIFIGIFLYILYFSFASFARYDNFYTGRFDLGNMDQTVWNSSRGRIFQLTDPNGTEIISRLSFHADFFLVFLAPLYKLWPNPKFLLLIQTIILAFGAFFVYLISKKILNNKVIPLILAIVFLLNPGVEHSNLYDFHSVATATTFLLGAFYFLLQKNYIWLSAFYLLAGSTKENIWLTMLFFGFFIFFKEKQIKQKLLGLFIILGSLSIFYYLVWQAIPQARGGQHFAISYYSDFGDSPTAIVKNAIFSPLKIVTNLIREDRFTYMFQLFFPLGFLSILSPLFLLFAAPDFFITLMSNNSQLRQIYYHYSASITPFLFISAIYGIKKIIFIYSKSQTYIPFYLIATTALSAYFFGPLPIAKTPNTTMFTNPLKNKEEINMFLAGINKHYSVAATNNLGSHLSHRQRIYTIPQGVDKADIIAFLLNDPSAQPSLASQIQMAQKLKQDNHYTLLFEKDDFIVFKRK